MKQLSRTTLWRRRAKPVRNGPPRGRGLLCPATEEDRLLLAAAVIQLARERGRGGFSEEEIRPYPRKKVGAPTPYPADPEVISKLRSSGVPAALLLVQAAEVCRPAPTDTSSERAGENYALHILPRQKREPAGQALTRLALAAVYQRLLARGLIAGKGRPAMTRLFRAVGIDGKRMRSYWRHHSAAGSARQMVMSLVGTRRAASRAVGTFMQRAVAAFLTHPASQGDKHIALLEASRLFDEYPPGVAPALANSNKRQDSHGQEHSGRVEEDLQDSHDTYEELYRLLDGPNPDA